MSRAIQCSLISMELFIIMFLTKVTKELKNSEMCCAGYEKPLQYHPLVAKKYVKTYSSSNAAARDPEERASYNIRVDSNRNVILNKK